MSLPTLTAEKLAELRRLAEAATPGPWFWGGHRKWGMRLSWMRPGWGQTIVMDFVRQGMRGAQPRFADDQVMMRKAEDLAVLEVPYREDIVAIDHPDARWIAAASPDVVLALLARIDELTAALADRPAGAGDYIAAFEAAGDPAGGATPRRPGDE